MEMTAGGALERIAATKGHIEQTLQRCRSAPYPSYERASRVQALLDKANEIWGSAQRSMMTLEGPARATFEASQQGRDEKQRELDALNRVIQDEQQIYGARQQEHNARIREAAAEGTDPAAISSTWNPTHREYQARNAELNRQRQELQVEFNGLNVERQRQQEHLNAEVQRVKSEPAPPELIEAATVMASVLDAAGVLEKEIASGANVQLAQSVTAVFRDKTEDFTDAESYHRNEATWTFRAMAAVILFSGVVTYFLFLKPERVGVQPSLPQTSTQALEKEQKQTSTVSSVERIAVLATGRLAILFFLGWTIRFLAALHQAHASQAIAYRDRKATLGVAELLLNATPEIEQKRAMLQTLTEAYLKFEQPWTGKNEERKRPTKSSEPEGEMAQLKETMKTLEPILELVGKAARKG